MTRPKDIDWSQVEDLGKVSDCSIAKRLKCNKNVVRDKRRKLGISVCPPSNWKQNKYHINWDEVDDLGEISPRQIAQRFGCSQALVRLACKARNIEIKTKLINWNTITDLGKTWDLTIAKRLGIKTAVVSRARARLGIPPYREIITCVCCGKTYKALKGNTYTCSMRCSRVAQDVARRLCLDGADSLNSSIVAAYKRTVDYQNELICFCFNRGIDWDSVTTLGILTDHEVAKQLGCAPSSVFYARYIRGIPRALRKEEKIDWDSVKDLGKVPDRIIAKRLGVGRDCIIKIRNKLNIQAYCRTPNTDIEVTTQEKMNNAEQQD